MAQSLNFFCDWKGIDGLHIRTFQEHLKEHSQLWDRADLYTGFSHFGKSSPQPGIKVHLGLRLKLYNSVLLDFQSFTEKPVLERAFAHPIMLFLSYFANNSMDRVSMTWKLAMKWYLMRMCAS